MIFRQRLDLWWSYAKNQPAQYWLYLIRVLFFGRPGYIPYYEFMRDQRLPVDPRSKRRAKRKAILLAIPLALVLFVLTNFLTASHFAFAPFTADWPNPLAIIHWYWMTWSGDLTPRDPKLAAALALVQEDAFGFANRTVIIDLLIILIFTQVVYWTNRHDRWMLSGEKGTADWIRPERLARTGLIPENYNIYSGFNEIEADRIAYDAELQRDHVERIREYAIKCENFQAEQAAAAGLDPTKTINLPVYGGADVAFASGATQTDVAAPWLEKDDDQPPSPPTPINLPDFR